MIKRYFRGVDTSYEATMLESSKGDYVRFEDYTRVLDAVAVAHKTMQEITTLAEC